MDQNGLKSVNQILPGGFYHDNLIRMSRFCSKEKDPNKLAVAYVLENIFLTFANQVESDHYNKIRPELESKYLLEIKSLIEDVLNEASLSKQLKRLNELIKLQVNSMN